MGAQVKSNMTMV